MCKFTTFILLFGMFFISSNEIKAQNTDVELLKQVYNNKGTVGLSQAISYTTTITAFGVPVTMATIALINKDDDLLKDALFTTAALGLNSVLTYSIKHAVNRQRPYIAYEYDFDRLDDYSGSSPSFPSGHTSLAFTTATSLSLKYPKWYVIAPSYIWAGYVGYSRMNLGVHYPSDVLAGAILGAGSAFVTYKINEWYWKKNDNKKLLPLGNYFK
jgi:membrane-associated phospholipid phosphatase